MLKKLLPLLAAILFFPSLPRQRMTAAEQLPRVGVPSP